MNSMTNHFLKMWPPILLGIVVAGAVFLNVATTFVLLLVWVAYSSKSDWNSMPVLAALFLAVWITVAQYWSDIGSVGWFTSWTVLAIPLAFIGWQNYSTWHSNLWDRVLQLLMAFGCVISIWGIFQVIVQEYPRATGPLVDPNVYACLLNLLWFPLFTRFLASKHSSMVRVYASALLIINLALMMSGSRAAALIWVVLCLGLIAWLWKELPKNRLYLIAAGAVVNYFIYSIFSSHLGLSSYGTAFDVLQTSNASDSPRLFMWLSTVRMWFEAPWLGSGLGSWNYLYPQFRSPDETGTAGYYAHNDYLQFLQEGGIITWVILVGVTAGLIFYGLKTLAKMQGIARVENAGIAAALGAAVFHAFVNFTFYLIYINVVIGIYLGRLVYQGRLLQPAATGAQSGANQSAIAALKKAVFVALIAVNGFHAILASTNLVLLREESWGRTIINSIAPKLNLYSSAALLSSIRPSDTSAQRYVVASLENGLINSFIIFPEQVTELFGEITAGYELLAKQNRLDATTPALHASFLIAYDKRFGIDPAHLQRSRVLLTESLQKNPYRADSAILLAETYFLESRPEEAFNILAGMSEKALNERDKLLLEAEIAKQKRPAYSKQIAKLQQELRDIKVHCAGKCSESNAQILESVHEQLNEILVKGRPAA